MNFNGVMTEKPHTQVLPPRIDHDDPPAHAQISSGKRLDIFLIIAVACGTFAFQNFLYSSGYLGHSTGSLETSPTAPSSGCRFPLPKLLASSPPSADDCELVSASASLDKYLSKRTSEGGDIDSLSIAVVTPAGTVFERGYGVLRANETEVQKQGSVDRDSIYRIASISKMFTVLETLILKERGALNWDDPVEKFLPEFSYPSHGWSEHLDGADSSHDNANKPRITLRQLATHMAGIGRDYPPADIEEWPTNGTIFPENKHDKVLELYDEDPYHELLSSIAKYPLVNVPYEYPIYSNSGFMLLGLSNVAANNLTAANVTVAEPRAHRELIKRDIFDPVGMHSSFFRLAANSTLKKHIAIPSNNSKWADIAFDDTQESAGGQFSSLGDLVTIMQTFLSPTAKGGVVSQHVMREWLRPLHTWPATRGFQQVGAPWEITVLDNGAALYTKGGSLPGYHSEFVLNPDYGYGIIVLLAGDYTNSFSFVFEALARFQPVFENILLKQVKNAYAGKWSNGDDKAAISIIDGALYLEKLVIRNFDLLAYIRNNPMFSGEPAPLPMWSTGRLGEFRMASGKSALNSDLHLGCLPYWVRLDIGIHSRGAPLDLIYWDGDTLVYPSAGVRFTREH